MRTRFALLPLLATALALAPARAEDATKVDPNQQSQQFSPTPDNVETKKNFDTQPDSKIQDHKADLPGLVDEPKAAVGDKRSPIEVGDTFQRKTYERKEAAISTTPVPHQESTMNGQTAPDKFQTTSTYSKSGPATQFQQKLSDAFATRQLAGPEVIKQTSFDRVNRFVFKHNAPGSDDGPSMVTAAGGGTASAATGAPQQLSSSTKANTAAWNVQNAAATDAPQNMSSSGDMRLLMVGSPGPVPKTLMVNGKTVPISSPASGTTAVPQP
jgi:hypothetical protein